MLGADQNDSHAAIVEHALRLFFEEDFKDGDLISVEWLEWALAITKPKTVEEVQERSFQLLSRFEDFRNTLLVNHQIALQNVRGKGYRIVPPEEQAEHAARVALGYIKKGISKGSHILRHARLDAMSTAARARHTDAQIKMAALNGMMMKGRRDVFALFDRRKSREG